MTWNHRVVRKVCEYETVLGIHEVYYDEDGVPYMVTMFPVGVMGDDLEDCLQTLEWMQKALREPVLEYSDFEEGGKYYSDSEMFVITEKDLEWFDDGES